MERALKLIASGTLTIAVARTMKGKKIALPSTFNDSSGKESNWHTSFTDAAWGKATRNYAKSAGKLTKVKFDGIVQAAQPPTDAKSNRARNKTTRDTEVEIESNDERACLVEVSDNDDGDGDCKSFYPLETSLI